MKSDADQPGCSQHNDTSTEVSSLNMLEKSEKDDPVFGCGERLNLFNEPDCAKKCFYRHAMKSFTCKMCDAKFSLKNNLKCDMLTHAGYISLKSDVSDTLFSPSGTSAGTPLINCGVYCVVLHSVELII